MGYKFVEQETEICIDLQEPVRIQNEDWDVRPQYGDRAVVQSVPLLPMQLHWSPIFGGKNGETQ